MLGPGGVSGVVSAGSLLGPGCAGLEGAEGAGEGGGVPPSSQVLGVAGPAGKFGLSVSVPGGISGGVPGGVWGPGGGRSSSTKDQPGVRWLAWVSSLAARKSAATCFLTWQRKILSKQNSARDPIWVCLGGYKWHPLLHVPGMCISRLHPILTRNKVLASHQRLTRDFQEGLQM